MDHDAITVRRRQWHHRVRRRWFGFGVGRPSDASLSIVVALCDVRTFPAPPGMECPSGELRLRGEEKKCQHVKVGARDYDDAHGTPWAHGWDCCGRSFDRGQRSCAAYSHVQCSHVREKSCVGICCIGSFARGQYACSVGRGVCLCVAVGHHCSACRGDH
jgi:hypothetical protein